MADLFLDSLAEYGINQLRDYVMDQLGTLIQQYIWVIILISIPALILAAAYCFFGIKIYRILLVIKSALGGGLVGALFLGVATKSNAGAFIGFILFAAIFGVLAWFFYKVFLFIQTFFTGLFVTGFLFLIITGKVAIALTIGILVGLALAILVCIYTKLFIMIMTAYQGAGSIASILSLFFITTPAYSIVQFLLLVAFTALGFYVQNRFFGDTYNGGKLESSMVAKYKLIGIEGMYKGFEFDLSDAVTFGRDTSTCNVIFPDTCVGVSRIQCEVTYDHRSKSVSVVDRYSSYGTTLNGAKLEINRPMPLRNGDVIMFGENNVFKLSC